MASAGACGSSSIASSAIRAAATSADSSWLVAVTVKTLSRVRSTFTATTLDEACAIELAPVEHDVAVRVRRDRELPLADEARDLGPVEKLLRERREA